MKQKLPLGKLIMQLLAVVWLAVGLYANCKACLWIRNLNWQNVWFFVGLIICVVNIVFLAVVITTTGTMLLRFFGRSAVAAELRLPRAGRLFSIFIVVIPLPVLIVSGIHAWMEEDAASQLLAGHREQFRSAVERLASFEQSIVGAVGAGEVYYQFGHSAFQRQDLATAEWCWQRSLNKWLGSRIKTGYGPIFELDDLGELFLLQGNTAAASQFFAKAVDLSERWQEQSQPDILEDERTLHVQAKLRALVGLGRIAESKGKLERSAELYKQALSLQKDLHEMESGLAAANTGILATLYLKLGKRADADETMKQALDYQKKAVGLTPCDHPFLGAYSERAQSALATYSLLLAAEGKKSEAKALDKELEAVARAKRRELNLPREAQDKLVDFILATTRKIIGIKYDTSASQSLMRTQLHGDLTDDALIDLSRLKGRGDWRVLAKQPYRQLVDVRVDQLSLSNKMIRSAIPVEIAGAAMLKVDREPAPSPVRFRLFLLVDPTEGQDEKPRITSVSDMSDQLKNSSF